MRVLPTNRRSLSGPGVILDPDRIQRTSCIASDARHVDARIPRLQTLSLLPLTLGDRLRSSCDAILETKSPRPIGHQMQVTRRRAMAEICRLTTSPRLTGRGNIRRLARYRPRRREQRNSLVKIDAAGEG